MMLTWIAHWRERKATAMLGEDPGYTRGAPQARNWSKTTGDSAAAKMVVLAGAEEEGIGDGFLWSKGEIKLGETLLVP